LLAVVVATRSADTVRKAVGAAVGAWPEIGFADSMVRAAVAPARVGHSSLGYGHLVAKEI